MPIPFSCPHCGKSMTVEDRFGGQTGPCAACGKSITIPHASASFAGPTPYGQPGMTKPPRSGGGLGVMMIVGVVCLVGCLGVGGILAALLMPAIGSARTAARRAQSSNNMKMISLALLNYQDANRQLPPAVVTDASGKPLYSWRVLILPYMEQSQLYERFDKSKAWDDPANIALSQTMLSVYQSPLVDASAGSGTNYFVIVGHQTMFPGNQGVTMGEITDGTSNTIALMELKGISGSWAAPIDPELMKINPTLGPNPGQLNPATPQGTNIAMGDGSVRFISNTIAPQMLQALFTRNGGEVVGDY